MKLIMPGRQYWTLKASAYSRPLPFPKRPWVWIIVMTCMEARSTSMYSGGVSRLTVLAGHQAPPLESNRNLEMEKMTAFWISGSQWCYISVKNDNLATTRVMSWILNSEKYDEMSQKWDPIFPPFSCVQRSWCDDAAPRFMEFWILFDFRPLRNCAKFIKKERDVVLEEFLFHAIGVIILIIGTNFSIPNIMGGQMHSLSRPPSHQKEDRDVNKRQMSWQ